MSLGPLLTDPEESLLRQVHPGWMQEGRPTSQAFRPTPKDEDLLSVSQGSLTTAANSYELYTRVRGLQSRGVWRITVGHCSDSRLSVYSDPLTDPVPDPAHAVVDFRGLSDKEKRARSQFLKAKAEPIYTDDSPVV